MLAGRLEFSNAYEQVRRPRSMQRSLSKAQVVMAVVKSLGHLYTGQQIADVVGVAHSYVDQARIVYERDDELAGRVLYGEYQIVDAYRALQAAPQHITEPVAAYG